VQSLVHSVEADASRMVASVLAQQHDASLHGQYAYLQYAHGQYGLSLCSRLPHRGDKGGCHEIFNSAWPAHPAHQAHMNSTRRAEHVEQLSVHGNHTANYVSLNPACVKMLVYPDQVYAWHGAAARVREAYACAGIRTRRAKRPRSSVCTSGSCSLRSGRCVRVSPSLRARV
jgi:hypothetical protein